jgi:hypothetical protein
VPARIVDCCRQMPSETEVLAPFAPHVPVQMARYSSTRNESTRSTVRVARFFCVGAAPQFRIKGAGSRPVGRSPGAASQSRRGRFMRPIPTHISLPPCLRGSRTSPPGSPGVGPSLTAAARDGRAFMRAGVQERLRRGRTKEWRQKESKTPSDQIPRSQVRNPPRNRGKSKIRRKSVQRGGRRSSPAAGRRYDKGGADFARQ